MAAAGSGPEALQAQAALEKFGKGVHADKTPTTFDQMVLASQLESDPVKQKQLDGAISRIQASGTSD